jgi:hypothetical protein
VVLVEITPEPTDVERQAILAALAAEEDEQPAISAWNSGLLPGRDDAEP